MKQVVHKLTKAVSFKRMEATPAIVSSFFIQLIVVDNYQSHTVFFFCSMTDKMMYRLDYNNNKFFNNDNISYIQDAGLSMTYFIC